MESGVVDGMELLEWLQTGVGDERDLQMMALEQLCMTLLMSDNIDRCFESCPPRTFLPALGRIFVDETAPENILEVTARAITYYLDVSNECTRRITQVDGAIKAICHRLIVAKMNDRTSKDLAEQCVKLLEHICQREASTVYDAGGLQAMLHLISHHDHLHKDTMHSAMAVITKLCAKMEPNDPNLPECSKNLGELLSHDDEKIAECSLRCFAAMTDRFIRRQMDPVDLSRPSNLVAHLFDFLIPHHTSDNFDIDQLDDMPEIELKHNSAFISAVLSLFANLCKGSPTVTNDILHSPKLVMALKIVLNCNDERSINDCLRFIDLLLILLCEGRASVSQSIFNNDPCSSQMFDKAHRSLIDAIRQRDTDALIDAVENGTVDPNFVDDVGQTLLNWCAAFGTTDMVIYLCDKGADPNKGQRSSSLHYAACFGRSEIVKILLRYGANPDLQDEEGRTALDKARERNDEAHQKVCEILQNPGAYMSTISSFMAKKAAAAQDSLKSDENEKIDQSLSENFIQQLLPVFCTIFKNSLSTGMRRITLSLIRKCIFHISNEGLLEIICSKGPNEQEKATGTSGFVELLIGVLIIILQSGENNIDTKEQALMIIKSLLLKDSKFWAEQLIRLGVYEKIETLAKAFDDEISTAATTECSSADVDFHIQQNNILSTLNEVKKESTTSSSRLGIAAYDRSATSTPSISLRSDSTVPSNDLNQPDITPSPTVEIQRQQSNSAPVEEEDNHTLDEHSGRDSPEFDNDLVEAATVIAQALGVQIVQDAATNSDEKTTTVAEVEDVGKIEQGVYYRWRDWRLIKSKDSLFIWCDAVALELSDGSNGWLRFLMNGRLSTLYSSGSPEYGADNADTRAEFIEKIQKAKAVVPSGGQTKSICTVPRPSAKPVESGNWQLTSSELKTLTITNREGVQQKLSIKDDLPGFVFESSRQQKQLFTAESTLGHDFVTGWAARAGGRRLRYFRVEVQKQKVGELAKEIWECYLKEACNRPREAILEIQKCSEELGKVSAEIIALEKSGENQKQLDLLSNQLTDILTKIRNSLSDDRLLSIFEISISGLVPALLDFVQHIESNKSGILAKQFSQIFADPTHLASLVRKIILVLESVEKFPQYLYDTPGGSPFGFQLLTRRLRFRFEHENSQADQQTEKDTLIDITNRSMKAEPLVTVSALKSYVYEHISNPKNVVTSQAGPSSTLSNLHYTRPPTAASLRMARKLPKMPEKMGGTSSDEHKHSGCPSEALLSARSPYVATGCLEKVGGNIKVKQASGKYAAGGSKQAFKKANTARVSKTLSSSRAQRIAGGHQKDLSTEKSGNESELGNGNGAGSSNMSQQQQKSMSTTNLFDANYKKFKASTSTFSQAASAESLQHQTPSLENLLSKARMHDYDYSIPEESMATPNSGSPEPKNLPTFENLPSRFEKRKGSETAQSLSIGASSFAGGSQPVLNSSSFSRERFPTVDSSSEKLEQQTESSAETINEIQKQELEVAELLQFMDAGPFMASEEFDSQLAGPNVPHIDEYSGEMDVAEGTSAQNEENSSGKSKGKPKQKNAVVANHPGASTSSKDTTELQPISNIGSNIRGKLGNYAEMLKHMMNQVFESGDSGDIYDGDDYDNEIYEDELLSQYLIEHEYEAPINDLAGGGFSMSSDASSVTGYAEPQQAHSSSITTASNIINEAAAAFDSFTQVAGNSRAAAVAAIRAAMERNDNIFSAIQNHPIEVMLGPSVNTSNSEQQRQRWRQMLPEELGNGNPPPPSMNNNEKGPPKGTPFGGVDGCARAIRMGTIRAAGQPPTSGGTGGWSDDFILRQQFGALIPAFDPRPGRTNVNQTQEVEVADNVDFNTFRKGSLLVDEDSKASESQQQKIRIYLKKSNKTNTSELIELKDDDVTLFYYVQQLLLSQKESNSATEANIASMSPFSDMNTQIWDNIFTLVYKASKNDDSRKDDEEKEENQENRITLESPPLVQQSLELVRILNSLNQLSDADGKRILPTLGADVFNSSKLTQKLTQELTDPLVVSAKTMPVWCANLVHDYPCFFSMNTRVMYLNTAAFGTSRAIGYLQGRRDQMLEQSRSATSTAGTNMAGLRREDHYPEYRIGRVKHERIKVHRNEQLFMENAIKVLKFHANRKSILEVEYFGEEGTGLGPTLEFYALVSSEFQRKDLCMWVCDDSTEKSPPIDMTDLINRQSKPPGYYVHSKSGLFPAAWPNNSESIGRTLEYFQIFGVLLAKAIQDDRLVDLPLSPAFLKLILSQQFSTGSDPLIESILGIDDLMGIYPEKAKMLKALINFSNRRKIIESNATLDDIEKAKQLSNLHINYDGTNCTLEDLSLTFAINPPSKIFPYKCAELVENGLQKEVKGDNVDLYIQKCLDFYLNVGIREQMLAFRYGFDMVFPLATLAPFSTSELQTILSGEQCPKWTREDLLRYTEPKLGYTRDSQGFLNFVEVLANFNPSERKAFLQFTTGCSSLPPGGLANLHPRLTVVRKVGSGDGSYPSVNTCVHYLKLPEYSSANILRERLLTATFEKGFHLN